MSFITLTLKFLQRIHYRIVSTDKVHNTISLSNHDSRSDWYVNISWFHAHYDDP